MTTAPPSAAIALLDFRAHPDVATMRVAGMTVFERKAREVASRGVRRVLVCGCPAQPVPAKLGLEIEAVTEPVADVPTVDGHRLMDVTITDERSRREAEWAVMQTGRRPNDGLGDRYVVRPMSLRISRFLTHFEITPNHVTIVSILVGLVACACVMQGGDIARLGGAFMIFQVVLDSVDGELARIRDMKSKSGMWLDNLADDIIDSAFTASVGIGMGGIYATIGIIGGSLRALYALFQHIAVARQGFPGDVLRFQWWFERGQQNAWVAANAQPSLGMAVRGLGRRDMYGLVFGLGCVIGLPIISLGLGATLGALYALMCVAHASLSRASA